jgi:hypothetical protein
MLKNTVEKYLRNTTDKQGGIASLRWFERMDLQLAHRTIDKVNCLAYDNVVYSKVHHHKHKMYYLETDYGKSVPKVSHAMQDYKFPVLQKLTLYLTWQPKQFLCHFP